MSGLSDLGYVDGSMADPVPMSRVTGLLGLTTGLQADVELLAKTIIDLRKNLRWMQLIFVGYVVLTASPRFRPPPKACTSTRVGRWRQLAR